MQIFKNILNKFLSKNDNTAIPQIIPNDDDDAIQMTMKTASEFLQEHEIIPFITPVFVLLNSQIYEAKISGFSFKYEYRIFKLEYNIITGEGYHYTFENIKSS